MTFSFDIVPRVRRFGGVCLVLYAAGLILFLLFSVLIGPGPNAGADAGIRAAAAHANLTQFLVIVVALAEAALVPAAVVLYMLLGPTARIRAGVGAIAVVLGSVVDVSVGVTDAFGKIAVAELYVKASSDTQRSAYLAASQLSDGIQMGSALVFVLFASVGLLALGWAMLPSRFPRWLGYFTAGVGTLGVIGMLGGSLIPILLPVAFVALLLTVPWALVTGVVLYRSKPTG